MKQLLEKINHAVHEAGGVLPNKDTVFWTAEYRALLKKAELECPPPEKPPEVKRGELKGVRLETYWKGLLIFKGMYSAS